MCVNRPGGRCKAPVVFDATEPYITCTANPRHGRAAYDKPYGKIVFGVLFGAIQEEEARQKLQQEEQQFQQDTREANREATVLGLAEYGVYTRPGGPAPDGKTWSFALGNWQDEDYLVTAPNPAVGWLLGERLYKMLQSRADRIYSIRCHFGRPILTLLA